MLLGHYYERRVDTTSDTIAGAHMLGPEYGELVNFCALAINSTSPPDN